MKTPATRLGILFVLVLLLSGSVDPVHAQVPAIPDYQVGDSATNTVKATVRISYVDPDATEEKREAVARAVYPFFRYVAGVSNSVESEFRSAFERSRTNFLKAVEATYGKAKFGRLELTDDALGKVWTQFQASNKGFPVTPELARQWVSGDDGLTQKNRWAEMLRRATAQVIRPSGAWAGSAITVKEVRLLSVGAFDEAISLYDAERRCRMFRRSAMVPLARVREDLVEAFEPGEREVAKFLSGLVQPNCDFDAELTGQSASPKTNDLWVYNQIEVGDTVVEAGQKVDARAKAALDELRKHVSTASVSGEVAQAHAEVATVRSQAAQASEKAAQLSVEAEQARRDAALSRQLVRWAGVAFCGLGLIAFVLWWKLLRRRPRAMVPVRVSDLQPVSAEGHGVTSTTMPYRMRRLLHERATLISCQQQAETEINRFEERLLALQVPHDERMKAYESRIQDLERQLSTRTEENLELIRAAIETTRRKLESERSAPSVDSN